MPHYYVTFKSILGGHLVKDAETPEEAVKLAKKRMGILNARDKLHDEEVEVYKVVSDWDGNAETYSYEDLDLDE